MPPPKQKTNTIKYDKYQHRVLVALRCAVSNRPFVSVEDEYYSLEVALLQPGTHICCSSAISKLTCSII
jgi:hypothetical protein